MEWFKSLFEGQKQSYTIQLVPDGEALDLPGFRNRGGLTLIAKEGETIGVVMARFNQFRGPDSQIRVLFTQDGATIPFSTKITGSVICVVRK
jgi:hypothetical protein